MKKYVITAALSFATLAYALPAGADDRLLRFEGGIGVIPVSRTTGNVQTATAERNTVRNTPPGGQPWVISRLSADVRTDGGISVDGRGLLLAGGDGIGTNGAQSVRARLFCGPAATATAHSSELVALEPNGDFRIDGVLTPTPPDPCATPVLLIISAGGNWFAAGIPKQ
jgi:hypothetical protein